ncbi:MAG: serine kinase [Deltaproteobacteria bacterium]|nr:serine kinase [Deltaproteobacteria bacterium]
MIVKDIVNRFGLEVLSGKEGLDQKVMGGHCGDLLSEVMGNAPVGCVWLTVQGHQNIVAVATLREMAAVIITGGQTPDPENIKKADTENIPILLYPGLAFDLAGQLYEAGVKNMDT